MTTREQSADAAAEASAQGKPATGDDGQLLRQEIEQTREHLGQTVEQLVAKVDVKQRAQARVAELTGQAKSMAGQAKSVAARQRERAVPIVRQRAVPLTAATATAALIAALLAAKRRKRRA